MNLDQRIHQHFEQSAQLATDCAGLLAPAIAGAASLIVSALLDDKKVIACGYAGAAPLADYFVSCMTGHFALERPGLAALSLSAEQRGLTPGLVDAGVQRYARPLLALGHRGDLLLVLCHCGNAEEILQAVRAAHEREMPVIAFTGADGGRLLELLKPQDIHIGIPHEHPARVQEVYLVALHSLCDTIDSLLLGVE